MLLDIAVEDLRLDFRASLDSSSRDDQMLNAKGLCLSDSLGWGACVTTQISRFPIVEASSWMDDVKSLGSSDDVRMGEQLRPQKREAPPRRGFANI